MRRRGLPTYGKRFVGNMDSKEVHDLNREKTGPNGCRIDEIIAVSHARTFLPDTLREAQGRGYKNCAKCMGKQ